MMYRLLAVFFLGLSCSIASAQNVSPGEYRGDGLSVRVESVAPAVRGSIVRGDQAFPFTAMQQANGNLSGTFVAGGDSFPFTLAPNAGQFVLSTGGKQYQLTPMPVNPLAAGAGGLAQPQLPRGDAPPAPQRVGNLVYEPRTIVDPRTNLEVCQLLVPRGWQIEPGILWREMAAVFVCMQSTIFDPQSGWAVRWIPQDQFNYNLTLFNNARQQGVAPMNPAGVEFTDFLPDARQYILNIVLPRYRNVPGLQVVGAEDLPAVADSLMRHNAFMIATYSQLGREMRYSAGHVVVEYPGPGGVTLSEDIYCVLNISWSPQAIAQAQQVGLAPDYFFMPDRLYSYTAPKGQLAQAEQYMQTIVLSARMTMRWYAFVENIQGRIRLILADRNAMEIESRKEITASQRKSVEESWKAADQQSREVGALLSGTQARSNPNNPNGPPIAGPAGMNTWVNKQGQTRHLPPGEDPNREQGSSQDWTLAKNAQN